MDIFSPFKRFSQRMLCCLVGLAGVLSVMPPVVLGVTALDSPAANQSKVSAISLSSFLHNFTGLALVDQHAKSFDPLSLKGQIVVFNFIFTRCGSICPTQTKDLASVLQLLPTNVRSQIYVVSVSVDPGHDTPETLRDFAKKMRADSAQWSFLTGPKGELQTLLSRLKVTGSQIEDIQAEAHQTSLWLMDKQGRMLQRYKGDPIDKKRLVRELTQVTLLDFKASADQ